VPNSVQNRRKLPLSASSRKTSGVATVSAVAMTAVTKLVESNSSCST
jgi:hypothetical protein